MINVSEGYKEVVAKRREEIKQQYPHIQDTEHKYLYFIVYERGKVLEFNLMPILGAIDMGGNTYSYVIYGSVLLAYDTSVTCINDFNLDCWRTISTPRAYENRVVYYTLHKDKAFQAYHETLDKKRLEAQRNLELWQKEMDNITVAYAELLDMTWQV